MAFRNAKIIKKLRTRGDYIKNEKWEKVEKISEEINVIKNDPEEFKKLTTPCSIFMTFETEEGYERALNLETAATEDTNIEHLKYWFSGKHQIEIQKASEPSDIIWENRQYTPMDRLKKKIIVSIIMFLLLLGSFMVIFYFSNISNKAVSKYPHIDPTTCEELNSGGEEYLQRAASASYRTNVAAEKLGFDVSYAKGYVQCFCDLRAE